MNGVRHRRTAFLNSNQGVCRESLSPHCSLEVSALGAQIKTAFLLVEQRPNQSQRSRIKAWWMISGFEAESSRNCAPDSAEICLKRRADALQNKELPRTNLRVKIESLSSASLFNSEDLASFGLGPNHCHAQTTFGVENQASQAPDGTTD